MTMTRKLLLPLLFAGVIATGVGCKSIPANYAGLDAYSDGNISKAIEHFDEAVSFKLGNFFIYRYHRNNRGVTNYMLGSYSDSLEDFNIALGIRSRYTTGRNNRSNLFLNRGDDERAMIDVDVAIDVRSGYQDARFNRARILLATQELDRALEEVNHAIALISDEDEADDTADEGTWALGFYLRGMILQQLGQIEAAERDFTRALLQDPELLYSTQEPYVDPLIPGALGR
ncbi:MAG: tetratricopeptide repeat protein [Candidatus Sumerlaeia bacterium]|nr:tetratricopeptide repeat protein [Candidatus Sumerlaeia bacterium]